MQALADETQLLVCFIQPTVNFADRATTFIYSNDIFVPYETLHISLSLLLTIPFQYFSKMFYFSLPTFDVHSSLNHVYQRNVCFALGLIN